MELPPEISTFMRTFTEAGHQIFVVGGAVRNSLLGKPITNWDFSTNARPEEIQGLFPHSFYHNTYGTVTVTSESGLLCEVTPFRKEERYSDNRHPDQIEWAKTIEEDLARRDFTINAMASDGEHIIDPYGGREHLSTGQIVAVGDPERRFKEDALRLMRAVRFAAQLGFIIEEKTRQAMVRHAGLIAHISWERIRDELIKILESNNPAEGILFLRNVQLLRLILPELDICFMVDQKSPKRHHIYDVGTHLVMSLKHCPSQDPMTRLATLLHDIGKAPTYAKDAKTGIITFYNHEVVGERLVKKIVDRLRLSNEQKKKVIQLVKFHQFTVSETQSDKAVRRFIRDLGKEYLDDMIALRTADRVGSGATPTSWRFELFKKRLLDVQKVPFSIRDLAIRGDDVMSLLSLPPSRQVGQILKELFEKVESGELTNTKEALVSEIEKKKNHVS